MLFSIVISIGALLISGISLAISYYNSTRNNRLNYFQKYYLAKQDCQDLFYTYLHFSFEICVDKNLSDEAHHLKILEICSRISSLINSKQKQLNEYSTVSSFNPWSLQLIKKEEELQNLHSSIYRLKLSLNDTYQNIYKKPDDSGKYLTKVETILLSILFDHLGTDGTTGLLSSK